MSRNSSRAVPPPAGISNDEAVSLSQVLFERQKKLYQVCAILRGATSLGDSKNLDSDVMYAVEAAADLLVPIAENLELAVMRREASEVEQ